MTPLDLLVGSLRPLRIAGKGRLFHRFVPTAGGRLIRVGRRMRMSIDLANGHQRMMYMGCFAREIETIQRSLLRPGDVFVDVGANVGYLTLVGADCVGPAGRVESIEPYPPTFEQLRRNISLSQATNVRAQNVALSDQPGTLTLHVPPAAEHREFNVSIVAGESTSPVQVPALTLDTLLDGVDQNVRLMKVDVEGAEPLVFAGGQKHLAAGRVGHVVVEVNGHYLSRMGQDCQGLVRQIELLGFVRARLRRGAAEPDPSIAIPANDRDDDMLFVHRGAVG